MTKSKLIFIVLFIGYIVIAILNAFGILSVGSIVLFGLSLAALLSSVSEAINGIIGILSQKNQIDFIAKCSIAFIVDKLNSAAPRSTNIADIANIRKNLEDQNPHYLKAVHSNEYWGRKSIKGLRIVMYFLDAGSILSFVVTPFIKDQQADLTNTSVFITLCAFGLMCLNVFISELQNDLFKKQSDFYNSTHILIDLTYQDFTMFLDSQLNHRVSLLTAKKIRAQSENGEQADTDMPIIKPVEDYFDVSNQ